MTLQQIWVFALGLLVVTVASSVAPTHPVYNPPFGKFVLGSMTLTAAIWAWEAGRWPSSAARDFARWPSPAARDPVEVGFVVSFDDRVISLANPDGTTESARLDEIESISIMPDDDPFLIWTGPFFVVLHVRGQRLRIPAFSAGMVELFGRLHELPGIDRNELDVLLRGGEPSLRVLWTREKGA